MLYWAKDCDCPKGGCTINEFKVDGKNEGGRVVITASFAPYRCAHCGKPWKQVEEKEEDGKTVSEG